MSNQETTVVIFRRWPKREGGEVFALFPYDIATLHGHVSSYEHIGQHASADLQLCINATTPASLIEEDTHALHEELERIGYKLEIKQRVNYDRYREAFEKVRAQYR